MKKLHHHSAKIKHVLIQMKDYEFFHSPFSKNVKYKADGKKKYDDRFFGRSKAHRSIVNILENSKTQSGTYLIAGYRGMGKTSVVRMAVAEANAKGIGKKKPKSRNRYLNAAIRFGFFLLLALPIIGLVFFAWDNWESILGLLVKIFSPSEWFLFVSEKDRPIQWIPTLLVGAIKLYVLILLVTLVIDTYYFCRQRYLGAEAEPALDYETFEISLSEDKISEEAILKRITLSLLEYWRKELSKLHRRRRDRPIYRPVLLVFRLFKRKSVGPNFESIETSLSVLAQRIVSQVTSQSSAGGNPTLSVGSSTFLGRFALPFSLPSGKQDISYNLATAKEIEDELILILGEIDTLRGEDNRLKIPRFVFIIDELDKIEVPGISVCQEDDPGRKEYDPIYTPDSTLTRRRQQALAALLGNLKNFLNVARAKFFFIGGRELFDANLADIADRDSFYSSIFNQTIYIPSFFKDKSLDRAGITQMTETYLCRMILHDLKRDNLIFSQSDGPTYNLSRLFDQLATTDHYLSVRDEEVALDQDPSAQDFVLRMMKYKVIFLLQTYIIYLNYRSNGTPKKLASLIESITVPGWAIPGADQSLETLSERNILVLQGDPEGNKIDRNAQYLRFKYDFQYEVAFTSELYRPYLIMKSRHIKALGDKLLFSNAFIFDHILKFHPYGFSWRHLEMIPEIILVNREPNLRPYMEELLSFLLKNNVRETTTGIFEYRFYNKVKTELTFLSKISDLGSAAFNFTLDESLQIKKHYRNKLSSLQKKYKDYRPPGKDNHFVHSIYFIQLILGDLHFYDQEYDEALIYYTESIQTLRLSAQDISRINGHQYVLWLKSKLKCALTLEKLRNYDSALIHYSSLTNSLRDIIQQRADQKILLFGEMKNMQLFTLPILGALTVIEKSRNDGITHQNILNSEQWVRSILEFDRKLPIEDTTIADDQLQIEEPADLLRKNSILGDFYNNLGGILFYKNCQFREYFERGGLSDPVFDKISFLKEAKDNFHKDAQPSVTAFVHYAQALYYLNKPYKRQFEEIIRELKELKAENYDIKKFPLSTTALYLLPKCSDFINSKKFYYYGNVLSRFGDAVLSNLLLHKEKSSVAVNFAHHKEQSSIDFNLADFSKLKLEKEIPVKEFSAQIFRELIAQLYALECKQGKDYFSMTLVFTVYRLAAQFYLRADKQRSAGFQYRKMLFVTKDVMLNHLHQRGYVVNFGDDHDFADPLEAIITISQSLSERVFKYVSRSLDIAGRPQILKYRAMLQLKKSHNRALLYQHINSSPDVKETILLTEQITAILKAKKGVAELNFDNFFISPYGMITSRYVRLFELEITAGKYYHYLKHVFDEANNANKDLVSIFDNWVREIQEAVTYQPSVEDEERFVALMAPYLNADFGNTEGAEANLSFIIKESIYCWREIIRSIHIYGLNNFVSYSYLARAHQNMGEWCQVYQNIRGASQVNAQKFGSLWKRLKGEVKSSIGSHSLAYLEANYHYEQAIQFNYRAISLHNEGDTYRQNVKAMFLLEDDQNDNLKHFVTALERFRCNTNSIRSSIVYLQNKIVSSKLYQYDSYHPVEDNSTP
ncbi:ATP-binding protein [Lewinella sp. W8]|uniref:ATP-binding protein n=1 Tax=Lewinella sp. W8 TaxID=2528208 RepID=UPI0010686EF3|nr:ATP-binding protein [Lewinella sp. W8]MTB51110.1 hypothetical protein [Lewinella sp. W8]